MATSSPWKMDFTQREGLSLRYEGIPVIRQSTLHVIVPDWSAVLYHQQRVEQQVERFDGENGPGLTVRGENDVFRSTYRVEALDDNRVQVVFQGELKQDTPARIEYSAGYFNGNLLSGVPFRGEASAAPTRGQVGAFPASLDQHANDVLPHFEWLEFDSRIGKLRVEADAGEERVMFFDARRDPQGWARPAPVFWCGLGVPSRPLTYGIPLRFEMTVSIQPDEVGAPSEVAEVETQLSENRAVQSSRDQPVRIIPTPKVEKIGGEGFVITSQTGWTIRQSGKDPRLEAALSSLVGDYGFDLTGRVEQVGSGPVEVQISDDQGARTSFSGEAEWFQNPEGYRLVADSNGITIASSTEQGAFYGLQTLAQLLRPTDDGVVSHAATIEDWPSMKFRGAHWFPSASGVPFHEKLIQRIMARYKLNHAVIQTEAALWESHPEIAAANSIHKPDLQGLVDLSRRNYINPIPLVNVPGHAEWIFRNDQNRHIVEDPEQPYAYCVNHPESWAFIQDILSEAIEIFRPDYFHLGHDEVTMKGRFPNPECPRCQDETATDLVLGHVAKLNDWLKERDIGMMIWGDMMLSADEIRDTAGFAPSREEAKYRRANLPDGLVVTDWHYYAGEEYPSLGYFHDEGHSTIAATFHRPQNIHYFAQAALKENSLGLLQTTWAGYFPDETVLGEQLHQFSAFILAAEYAWSGRDDPPSALSFDRGTEFTRAYYRIDDEELPGSTVNISEAARTPRKNWLNLGAGWDFSSLPTGEARVGGLLFLLPENLVVLGGSVAPDSAWKRVSFEIEKEAGEIAMLNAAAFDVPSGTVPARLTVFYADGSKSRLPLVMGETTAHWGQDAPARSAPVAWQKVSPAETPLTLRVTRWTNPHPEKIVSRIEFEAVDPEQAWALVGLTLID